MTNVASARAAFTRMDQGTSEDWQTVTRARLPYARELPQRVMAHLETLRSDHGGLAVDRLEHSLQTATRAHQAGRDEHYVVCALLHDIGDVLGTYNHADIAAAILKPFVSQADHWMVENHATLQGYYYFHHVGLDRNLRDKLRDHPAFGHTAEFCELFDQNSFDPNFQSMPLEAFEPMVGRVMSAPAPRLLSEL